MNLIVKKKKFYIQNKEFVYNSNLTNPNGWWNLPHTEYYYLSDFKQNMLVMLIEIAGCKYSNFSSYESMIKYLNYYCSKDKKFEFLFKNLKKFNVTNDDSKLISKIINELKKRRATRRKNLNLHIIYFYEKYDSLPFELINHILDFIPHNDFNNNIDKLLNLPFGEFNIKPFL